MPSAAPNFRWFADGQLNASFNCLDVQLASRRDKTALIFEAESGAVRQLTYGELHAQVCALGNALRALGVREGDRVILYMPLVPEAIVAMHACARIGAVHSVVFGGFSALSHARSHRGCRGAFRHHRRWRHRGGKVVELKAATDKALSESGTAIEKVIVLKHTGLDVPMQSGRDLWWHDVVRGQNAQCEPAWVEAEHPLFLL